MCRYLTTNDLDVRLNEIVCTILAPYFCPRKKLLKNWAQGAKPFMKSTPDRHVAL